MKLVGREARRLIEMIAQRVLAAIFAVIVLAWGAPSQAGPFTSSEVARVDRLVADSLAASGAPSASVAVARGGEIVFARAYGVTDLVSRRPATTATRYRIGSVSKQFTATAILLLADRGKLSLDDPVARWIPEIGSQTATVRQALTHTGGFAEFWPTDYLLPTLKRSTTAVEVARRWGAAPPNFAPGTKWSYSNTGYNALGLIVERAAGLPLDEFLKRNVFMPLGMRSAIDVDGRSPGIGDALGYERTADGPPRIAQQPARGWTFAAGDLAMTAEDLALWDLNLVQNRLLSPATAIAQQAEQKLVDGSATGYGFGVFLGAANGHRLVSHNGILPGFLSENRVYPDDAAAIVVLVNGSYGASPHAVIANGLEEMLFPRLPSDALTATPGALMRGLIAQIAAGELDRTLLTPDADDYLRGEIFEDYRESFVRLGKPLVILRQSSDVSDGLNVYQWMAVWPTAKLIVILRTRPDGKVQEFYAYPVD